MAEEPVSKEPVVMQGPDPRANPMHPQHKDWIHETIMGPNWTGTGPHKIEKIPSPGNTVVEVPKEEPK